ncbi:Cell division septal protein FtsQ [Abditibacterium utsteinense]|uniref:Cell division septal protein FtsQ n=1 Tax=Abditibacterium utsteinense TaxID=1960156 RepID=A0A2S8SSI0_9BACT|nr:FtsQ-type POTRA domain-containing protein [Abditibacterium utsteinense]PQV63774.1 Cell division septal protein FtsQ [Abditibacterium utsteinense]
MSQPSSSSFPHRFDPDSDSDVNPRQDSSSAESDSGDSQVPRRLLSPRERFSTEEFSTGNSVQNSADNALGDEVVREPTSSPRLDDEMTRRHLPPRERRRHERARIQREMREERRRAAHEAASHAHHLPRDGAFAERDFVLGARGTAPAAPLPKRRMPLFLKRILWLVALLFVGQLGFAAFTAPQFEIKSVEIEGLSATPPESLRPFARRLVGQNILRAGRAAVENAARKVPTVADAKVVRKLNWPPKVALQITERQPLLKVGAGQNWWIIDQNGVAFRRSGPKDEAFYSVVAPQFKPALRQNLEPKTWGRVRALNAAIRRDNDLARTELNDANAETSPFWQLRRIYFDKDGLASLRVTRAAHREMLVRLGDDAWPEKLARARVALAYFERTNRKAAELDLVSLERPVWTPIVAQTGAKPAPDAS